MSRPKRAQATRSHCWVDERSGDSLHFRTGFDRCPKPFRTRTYCSRSPPRSSRRKSYFCCASASETRFILAAAKTCSIPTACRTSCGATSVVALKVIRITANPKSNLRSLKQDFSIEVAKDKSLISFNRNSDAKMAPDKGRFAAVCCDAETRNEFSSDFVRRRSGPIGCMAHRGEGLWPASHPVIRPMVDA
jgi:hypothetical protein